MIHKALTFHLKHHPLQDTASPLEGTASRQEDMDNLLLVTDNRLEGTANLLALGDMLNPPGATAHLPAVTDNRVTETTAINPPTHTVRHLLATVRPDLTTVSLMAATVSLAMANQSQMCPNQILQTTAQERTDRRILVDSMGSSTTTAPLTQPAIQEFLELTPGTNRAMGDLWAAILPPVQCMSKHVAGISSSNHCWFLSFILTDKRHHI